MNKFTEISLLTQNMLCCPLCKSALNLSNGKFTCHGCASDYNSSSAQSGNDSDIVFDFRIKRPDNYLPQGQKKWSKLQEEFEDFHDHYTEIDNEKVYLDEIESVKEIYREHFDVKGKVLDVGGNQGRLRHFLPTDATYVSIDPYPGIFKNIIKKKNLLTVYPKLSEPCNFVVGFAENLPFKNESFNWVHMRSVIDHFADPFLAIKEAYRVLAPGGRLLIGLAIEEKGKDGTLVQRLSERVANEGISSVLAAVKRRAIGLASGHHDDHMFRFSEDDLLNLVKQNNFEIEKIHWQKPPFSYCIYFSAKKK